MMYFHTNHVEPEATSPVDFYGPLHLFKGFVLFVHSTSFVHFHSLVSGLDLLSGSLPSNRRDRQGTNHHRTGGEDHDRDVLWKGYGSKEERVSTDLEVVS